MSTKLASAAIPAFATFILLSACSSGTVETFPSPQGPANEKPMSAIAWLDDWLVETTP